MAKGALWYQQMLDNGWLIAGPGAPKVNVQKCRDVVSVAEETEFLFFGQNEDESESEIALFMLASCVSAALDDDEKGWELAARFIISEVVAS